MTEDTTESTQVGRPLVITALRLLFAFMTVVLFLQPVRAASTELTPFTDLLSQAQLGGDSVLGAMGDGVSGFTNLSLQTVTGQNLTGSNYKRMFLWFLIAYAAIAYILIFAWWISSANADWGDNKRLLVSGFIAMALFVLAAYDATVKGYFLHWGVGLAVWYFFQEPIRKRGWGPPFLIILVVFCSYLPYLTVWITQVDVFGIIKIPWSWFPGAKDWLSGVAVNPLTPVGLGGA